MLRNLRPYQEKHQDGAFNQHCKDKTHLIVILTNVLYYDAFNYFHRDDVTGYIRLVSIR